MSSLVAIRSAYTFALHFSFLEWRMASRSTRACVTVCDCVCVCSTTELT
jgi:hypothetical protein